MVLRPSRMVRLAIVAPHARDRQVIEALYAARVLHLEEYTEGRFQGLGIGEPLAEASKASERLVRIRGLVRNLGLSPSDAPGARLPSADVVGRLDETLTDLEMRITSAIERRDHAARELEARLEERVALKPLADLPLDLADLAGYEALKIFVGAAEPDVGAAVRQISPGALVVRGAEVQVLFVPARDADRVGEALTETGFKATETPRGTGSVPANLARVEAAIAGEQGKLEAARADLDKMRTAHGPWLLAAEEHLSIEVEKAEAPLAFGHSERAFVVDAWVPEEKEGEVRSRLESATGGAVHIEVTDRGLRAEHDRAEEPPTQYKHPKVVRPFSFFLDLFARPRYGELDPTLILFLLFPLFFGFMIGDLGYGVLLFALGLFLYRRIGLKSEAARGLGFAMLIAGLWAAFFGGLIFHDAFGIAYVAHKEGELSWFDAIAAPGEHAVEGIGLTGMSVSAHSWLAHPVLEKLGDTDIKSMLVLSIVVGFAHLVLGYTFAIVNHWSHSRKHVVAQFGWLAVLVGFFTLVIAMSASGAPNPVSTWLMGTMGQPGLVTHSLPLIVVGFVTLIVTEGALAGVEVLTVLSHIISYTRLAGIAVAKGGMAMGFNGLFLKDMALGGSGVIIVVGVIMFFVAQLVLFILGILSSGIQAIRLQYVEFFLKFYKGGGKAFAPFGRERLRTHANIGPSTP